MIDSNQQATHKLSQKRTTRIVRDIKRGQIWWVVGCIVLAIPFWLWGRGTVGLIFSLLLPACAFLAWPLSLGPAYRYPTHVWYKALRIRFKGNQVYTDTQAIWLYFFDFLGLFGTIYNREEKTDTVYLRVGGFRPANTDNATRWYADLQIINALKTAVAQTINQLQFGFVVGNRPFDPTQWAGKYKKKHVHKDFLNAHSPLVALRKSDPVEFMKQWNRVLNGERKLAPGEAEALNFDNTATAFEETVIYGAKYYRVVYLKLKRPKFWKRIAENKEKFDKETLRGSKMMQVFTALKQGLESAGFDDVEIMQVGDIQQMVFDMWNVRTIAEARQTGQPANLQENVVTSKETGESELSAFPAFQVETTDEEVITDGCEHSLHYVKRYKNREVLPGAMPLLFGGNTGYVMSGFRAKTVSANKEGWILTKGINAKRAFRAIQNPNGVYEYQKDRDQEAADISAVDDLHSSASSGVRHNQPILVSGSNAAAHKENVEALYARYRLANIELGKTTGRAVLLAAFLGMLGV